MLSDSDLRDLTDALRRAGVQYDWLIQAEDGPNPTSGEFVCIGRNVGQFEDPIVAVGPWADGDGRRVGRWGVTWCGEQSADGALYREVCAALEAHSL